MEQNKNNRKSWKFTTISGEIGKWAEGVEK